jgi:hypothetical protein
MEARKAISIQLLGCSAISVFASVWLKVHEHQPTNHVTVALVVIDMVIALYMLWLSIRLIRL